MAFSNGDHRLPVYVFDSDVNWHTRRAAVHDGIDDAVHLRKHLIVRDATHSPVVRHAEKDTPAPAVGERDHRLQVFDSVLVRDKLEFKRL